jgi:hypothetical protein
MVNGTEAPVFTRCCCRLPVAAIITAHLVKSGGDDSGIGLNPATKVASENGVQFLAKHGLNLVANDVAKPVALSRAIDGQRFIDR